MTFLWGTATAAHQIEGGNSNNDCWALESAPDSPFVEPSGDACDSFHRYGEDIALVASMGLNAYRFSLEWSRIEPAPGDFSQEGLAHYKAMVDSCLRAGLQPVVTLHHFTNPQWMAARGGWLDPGSVELFTRFTEAVLPILADVEVVCTLNEPNVLFGVAHLLNGSDPDPVVRDHLLAAHRSAVEVLHRDRPRRVGLTVAMRDWIAAPGGSDKLEELRRLDEDVYLEGLTGDFIGVQTYTKEIVDASGAVPPSDDEPRTLTGWHLHPAAIGATVRRAAALTGLPVIVTENGIATANDEERIAYVQAALHALDSARADGVDVQGWFYWSLLDNFEWLMGYAPTFGLVAVDRTTFVRTLKPSATWLGDEIARRLGH